MATVFSDQKGITQSLYQIVIQSSLWVHERSTRKTDNLYIIMKTARKHVSTDSLKVAYCTTEKERNNTEECIWNPDIFSFVYFSLCTSINKSAVNKEEQELLSDQHWY